MDCGVRWASESPWRPPRAIAGDPAPGDLLVAVPGQPTGRTGAGSSCGGDAPPSSGGCGPRPRLAGWSAAAAGAAPPRQGVPTGRVPAVLPAMVVRRRGRDRPRCAPRQRPGRGRVAGVQLRSRFGHRPRFSPGGGGPHHRRPGTAGAPHAGRSPRGPDPVDGRGAGGVRRQRRWIPLGSEWRVTNDRTAVDSLLGSSAGGWTCHNRAPRHCRAAQPPTYRPRPHRIRMRSSDNLAAASQPGALRSRRWRCLSARGVRGLLLP